MIPFPGLRPFGYDDRRYFFGRERDKYTLYRLIDRSRFVAVIGSSGCGKSSLVRAGLLPLLDEETQSPRGRNWQRITFTPGDAPLDRLGDALMELVPLGAGDELDRTRREIRRERIGFALQGSSFGLCEALDEIPAAKGSALLIVVDQFEELFRFAAGAARDPVKGALWKNTAAAFVEQLLEASRDPARDVHVVITMRSDFIGDCAQFYELPEAVSTAQFLVPSLNRDQRREVVVKQIETAGGTIDPTLVETIVNDAGGRIDELPVLQHCLRRMWDTASEALPAGAARHLEPRHYRAVGCIAGALSQHADAVLAKLAGCEETVQQVFRTLCERDSEGRATRRALTLRQVLDETGRPESEVRLVVDRFRGDDCSFLVVSPPAGAVVPADARIDVGHEALLRNWQKISAEGGWLDAEEAEGRFYRAILALLEP